VHDYRARRDLDKNSSESKDHNLEFIFGSRRMEKFEKNLDIEIFISECLEPESFFLPSKVTMTETQIAQAHRDNVSETTIIGP